MSEKTAASAQPETKVRVGEPIPWFSAASDADGGAWVSIDELGGRHLVLFFLTSLEDPEIAGAVGELARREDLFDGVRGALVAVTRERRDFANELFSGNRPGQYYLWDQSGNAARQFGLTHQADDRISVNAVAFVIDPTLRVVGIVPVMEAQAFADQIDRMLRRRLSAPAAESFAPILIASDIFDRDLCLRLMALYDTAGGTEQGAIERDGKALVSFDTNFRKRLDYHIKDESVVGLCREMLSRRLLPMVFRAFQFKTTRIERYLVGCYDSDTGGYFRPHRDNTQPIVAHRRFALSVLLNEDFDGGELAFPEFGDRVYRAKAGDAFVFSCSLLHEVRPVTRGRRFAFVSFFFDEASQRIREQNMRSPPTGRAGSP